MTAAFVQAFIPPVLLAGAWVIGHNVFRRSWQ